MRLAIAALALWLGAMPALAQCDTKINRTDGFDELTAKLECLNARIDALEARLSGGPQGAEGAGGSGATTPAESITVLDSGCFSASPGTTGTTTFEATVPKGKRKPLCFADGTPFAALSDVAAGKVTCFRADDTSFPCYFDNRYKFTSKNSDIFLTIGKVGPASLKILVEFTVQQ